MRIRRRRGSCRRASTPAAPRRRPRRTRFIAASSSASRLFVPSLKPWRLRGVGLAARRRRGAAEAELGPAERRRRPTRAGEVAHRVERDLRVVGAGLDAEVAVGARRLRGCRPGTRAARRERRSPRGEAEPLEQRRPSPKVTVSRAGAEPERLAGIERRRGEVASTSPTGRPAVMSGAARGPVARRPRARRGSDVSVEGGERPAGPGRA